MITILFDIDGTLIRSAGAGMMAIGHVMKQMFGIREIECVPVHGRTDHGILSELFEQQSLSFDEHRSEFNNRYWSMLPETLSQCPGVILPGVEELLAELDQNEDVALGILTGNSKRAAEIKLRHFEIFEYFEFGGYGDVHSCRNDVASMARSSAEDRLADDFEAEHLWVVGDTVSDITCARSIASKVVAVETGGLSEKLSDAQPDVLLPSLFDTSAFLQAVIGSPDRESNGAVVDQVNPVDSRKH